MERLEFIGDSVLKLFCSSHVYFHFPYANEGQMTSLRNQLVSNAHFYICGKKKGLGEILAGGIFIPDRTWTYPGVHLQPNVASALARNDVTCLDTFAGIPIEKLSRMTMAEFDEHLSLSNSQEPGSHQSSSTNDKKKELPPAHVTYTSARLGDKNIADCLEALVGAYFTHGGLWSAARVMTWLGLQAPTASGEILNYDLKRRGPEGVAHQNPNVDNIAAIVDRHLGYVDELEDQIGYK